MAHTNGVTTRQGQQLSILYTRYTYRSCIAKHAVKRHLANPLLARLTSVLPQFPLRHGNCQVPPNSTLSSSLAGKLAALLIRAATCLTLQVA